MNQTALKNYAPKARESFIQAVTDRAAIYGLSARRVEPMVERGEVAMIGDRPFPIAVAAKRRRLEERIAAQGFDSLMESLAYTWFNRLLAIRYMELHGYLDHRLRVLSHPDAASPVPEILEQAEDVRLPGISAEQVLEMKLAGNRDDELYRLLLLAQCNALHEAMPFLFERIDDETELLLPDQLLRADSIVRTLVAAIPEEDWQEVEIIGWLYQYYILDEKKRVEKKVEKGKSLTFSEIPAKTQLFTPNWIVRYLVENSLGRQWLEVYPDSPLHRQMAYYIEPAEQDETVARELDRLTPASLDPEKLTLLDPACGSGHILVEAYDLLKQIYLERGYTLREIPEKILRHNLFGLEIDPRAAQLASFALLMKARADDDRLLDRGRSTGVGGPWLNIRCIQSSEGLDAQAVFEMLAGHEGEDDDPGGEWATHPLLATIHQAGQNEASDRAEQEDLGFTVGSIRRLLEVFEGERAATFGSLIRIPKELVSPLEAMVERADRMRHSGDVHRAPLAERFFAIAEQALLLSSQYDAVVANPPYMGSKGQNKTLKDFAKAQYPDSKTDLFAMFLERGFELAKPDTGYNAMVTMQSWMFLSSYKKMRKNLLDRRTIVSLAHLGPGAFRSISGEKVNVAATNVLNRRTGGYKGSYFRLIGGKEEAKNRGLLARQNLYTCRQSDFHKIPGSPVAYWVSNGLLNSFCNFGTLGTVCRAAKGLVTGNNVAFVREWCEIRHRDIAFSAHSRKEAKVSHAKWFPFAKGGAFRKWFGNQGAVVDWYDDGANLRSTLTEDGSRIRATNFNLDRIFRPGCVWTVVTNGLPSFRYVDFGFLFDAASGVCQSREGDELEFLAFLNSLIGRKALELINPTINLHPGYLEALPFERCFDSNSVIQCAKLCLQISQSDWDAYETSWDFQVNPLLDQGCINVSSAYDSWRERCRSDTAKMKELEEENNGLFIEAYGLEGELSPEVPIEQITLFANPAYRYPGKRKRGEETATLRSEEELERLFREDTAKDLVSYAVGCMMGRYSLDEPGLIYADSGNEGFDPGRYRRFAADGDGIVPLMEGGWFDAGAEVRLEAFLAAAWPAEQLQANLQWLADSLMPDGPEPARERVVRYLTTGFYKDHLQRYKKRPIYWLFSSGPRGAFSALVYLHRYHEGTLARMRTEYVIPLQGKMNLRMEKLAGDLEHATSGGRRRRLEKELEKLKKQQLELQQFDEKLRHYADQRIVLDLDDGVKVNYAKFGDLLACVKEVCGTNEGDW